MLAILYRINFRLQKQGACEVQMHFTGRLGSPPQDVISMHIKTFQNPGIPKTF